MIIKRYQLFLAKKITKKKLYHVFVDFNSDSGLFLVTIYDVGYMDTYFYCSYFFLLLFLSKLWKAKEKIEYVKLHVLLKVILYGSNLYCSHQTDCS